MQTSQSASSTDRDSRSQASCLADRIISAFPSKRKSLSKSIMSLTDEQPIGIEFKYYGEDRWAFIAPEMSTDYNAFRIQYFDNHGFFSHATRDSLKTALEEMVAGGYVHIDKGALDRTAQTIQWKIGTEITELIALLNQGSISFADYLERRQEIKTRSMAGIQSD